MAFSDLLVEGKIYFFIDIKLAWYIFSACGNWNNYDSNKSNDNKIIAKVKNNNNDKNMEKGSPYNLYELYGIYN